MNMKWLDQVNEYIRRIIWNSIGDFDLFCKMCKMIKFYKIFYKKNVVELKDEEFKLRWGF
jgi:hypothetical protein